jgi:ribosomal protein S8
MAWYRIMLDYGNCASLKHPSYIEYVQLKNDKEAKDYVAEIGDQEKEKRVVGGFQKVRKPPRKYIEEKILSLIEKIVNAKIEKKKWDLLMEKYYAKKL